MNSEHLVDADKKDASGTSGHAPRKNIITSPAASSEHDAVLPNAEKLTALPNEATIENLNEGKPPAKP